MDATDRSPGLEPFNKTESILLRYKFSVSSLNRYVSEGTFPKPEYFGTRRRWRREDLQAWEAGRRKWT